MSDLEYGPTLTISEETHAKKHRLEGESFYEAQTRIANALKDSHEHFSAFRGILLNQRFMGAGRVQSAVGAPREVTAFNCFVSGTLEDSLDGIMHRATEAAFTMKAGGGIGYDFSTLRPRGDRIVSLGSRSSGPISFMGIFNAICSTIASAGHRRGAQMAVMRVDHPDIEEFVRAKQNDTELKGFNMSLGITDKFMQCVKDDTPFDLVFEGKVYDTISARNLYEEIMRSTWDWAEPGFLLIDRINEMNNLWYCETIAATNPCGEQPLPPYGACLLGSFNLVKYLKPRGKGFAFDFAQFEADIPVVVRAMDNIHDIAKFPLPEQRTESHNKRRMGLGYTGLANAGELCGNAYGSEGFLKWSDRVMKTLRDCVYHASIDLAAEKGSFPALDKEKYCLGGFIKTLPKVIRERIQKHGIRNSHLLSIAPTGTLSLTADNVSSGAEPVFAHEYSRIIQSFDGPETEVVQDWAYREHGLKGRTATECTAQEHLAVLALATKYVDSAVSKTINVDPNMPWEEFTDVYMQAWEMGCKGVTTFNPSGKRFGILNASPTDKPEACFIDEATGSKTCE